MTAHLSEIHLCRLHYLALIYRSTRNFTHRCLCCFDTSLSKRFGKSFDLHRNAAAMHSLIDLFFFLFSSCESIWMESQLHPLPFTFMPTHGSGDGRKRAPPLLYATVNSVSPCHISLRYIQEWVVPSASLVLGSIWTPLISLPGKDDAWGRERGEIETLWLLIRSRRSPLVLQEPQSVCSPRAPRYAVIRCHLW